MPARPQHDRDCARPPIPCKWWCRRRCRCSRADWTVRCRLGSLGGPLAGVADVKILADGVPPQQTAWMRDGYVGAVSGDPASSWPSADEVAEGLSCLLVSV